MFLHGNWYDGSQGSRTLHILHTVWAVPFAIFISMTASDSNTLPSRAAPSTKPSIGDKVDIAAVTGVHHTSARARRTESIEA